MASCFLFFEGTLAMDFSLDEHTDSLLTDEERAAIAEGEEEDSDEPDVPDKAQQETPAPNSAPVTTPAPNSAAPTQQEAFQPQYQSDVPSDIVDQIAAIKAQTKALSAQMFAGEIDSNQYNDQLETLTEQREQLSLARVKSEIFADMQGQNSAQSWQFSVNRFMEQAAKGQVDYRQDAKKRDDLDLFVKALANDDRHAHQPMAWFLNEAHRLVKGMHGLPQSSPAQAPPVTNPRKSPTEKLPATLANIPGSDGPGDLSGEFSDVDKLEGFELEEAIAKMTPAQRDRFSKA
jgi:hypothetical protein